MKRLLPLKYLLPSIDVILVPICLALIVSVLMLRSIAPSVFPQYYIYITFSVLFFAVFQKIEFDTLAAFSWILYIGSIALLLLPIVIGEVTRGTIRWIPLGSFNLQPAEIVRPFLILFFSVYFGSQTITAMRLVKSLPLVLLPVAFIFLQPSLGVAIMTLAGCAGVIFSYGLRRKYIIWGIVLTIVSLPLLWLLLQPYQKTRVLSLLSPYSDPSGHGYNSIQSIIAVGSGKFSGRGLGNGVQTQLSFLPEKHTDFMFAAISEELGFIGSTFVLAILGFLLYRLLNFASNEESNVKKAFIIGVFCTLFLQIFVHVGMNMGMLPITGLPLPLISYGGSSLLSTMITLGISLQVGKSSSKIQSI